MPAPAWGLTMKGERPAEPSIGRRCTEVADKCTMIGDKEKPREVNYGKKSKADYGAAEHEQSLCSTREKNFSPL